MNWSKLDQVMLKTIPLQLLGRPHRIKSNMSGQKDINCSKQKRKT